jgi:hypothetical protein
MHTRPWYSLLAPAGVAVYVVAVILGAALYPGYSHLADTISSLTNPTAPNLGLMNALFAVYNLCCLLFGIGWAADRGAGTRLTRATAIMISAAGLLGLVMYFFPQDPMGGDISARGSVHIAIAGAMSLLTMVLIVLRGLGELREPGSRGRAVYSFVSVGVVFVTGGCAAVGVAEGWAVGGLLERLTIGAFLQWLAVQGIAP